MVPVSGSSDAQMCCRHGFCELAVIFVEIACAHPNACFRQKLWPKTIIVYFLTAFYVEILRMQRATHAPNVTEWHTLGWTMPALEA
jgi:hypothetical protein